MAGGSFLPEEAANGGFDPTQVAIGTGPLRSCPATICGGCVPTGAGGPTSWGPAWAPKPGIQYAIVKMHAACNWAQVLEGSIDSAHSSSLHSTEMPAASVDTSSRRSST